MNRIKALSGLTVLLFAVALMMSGCKSARKAREGLHVSIKPIYTHAVPSDNAGILVRIENVGKKVVPLEVAQAAGGDSLVPVSALKIDGKTYEPRESPGGVVYSTVYLKGGAQYRTRGHLEGWKDFPDRTTKLHNGAYVYLFWYSDTNLKPGKHKVQFLLRHQGKSIRSNITQLGVE